MVESFAVLGGDCLRAFKELAVKADGYPGNRSNGPGRDLAVLVIRDMGFCIGVNYK